ncbi:helix-turn-helix domain-containing protein [Pseudodonghicola sp.]|uniref:helix-turn-helix domain-containing protein n=1 Tax=Pseudodonghicola sp. TaxID=1969463 RepID=UPI003A97C31A
MPAIPLPFIVSGALVLLLLSLLRRQSHARWFILFLAACAAQSALVGMRWSLGLGELRFVQPVLAACLPVLALTAFASLGAGRPSLWHAVWPVAILALWGLFPAAIDPLLVVEFMLYGVLIWRFPLPEEGLARVRIGSEGVIVRARAGVAGLLGLSALSDAVISLALLGGEPRLAAAAVAAVMSVLLVGLAGGVLAQGAAALPEGPDERPAEEPAPVDMGEEAEAFPAILATVEAVLAQGLYRDYDLTLQRLARRVKIPARKISRAVNDRRGCSVSDLVNGYRVREAMRLLRDSDLPVTQVMLEAGFQTKSNFNRVFKETAGVTPSAYRSAGN